MFYTNIKQKIYFAFPSCKKTILNDTGNFVGQVCHIEAAMPGGERFNPNQTNGERRAFSNLIFSNMNFGSKTF
ncbi:hypothetical protein FSZ17_14485 [Cytobacillus dafuensis]|uniref:Uncharacterized protein n=1 Tax=Cytobacillus dafuensis TaxID=1742359 RepID=A0A5B8Z628_CYTDA|nr:hypothetical protein FSZ17_14485 [Cytobacillus dafuensis]